MMELSFPVPKKIEILGNFSNKWFDFVSRFCCRQKQNGQRRTSFLLHYGADMIKDMQASHKLSMEDLNKFSYFVEALEHDFLFQICLSFFRYLFFNHTRKTAVGTEEYYTELKLFSELCSFESAAIDALIKDIIIINSFQDESVRKFLVNDTNLTAKEVVDICCKVEQHGGIAIEELLNISLSDKHQKLFESPDESQLGNTFLQKKQTECDSAVDLNKVISVEHDYANVIKTHNLAEDVTMRHELDYFTNDIFTPMGTISDLTTNYMSTTLREVNVHSPTEGNSANLQSLLPSTFGAPCQQEFNATSASSQLSLPSPLILPSPRIIPKKKSLKTHARQGQIKTANEKDTPIMSIINKSPHISLDFSNNTSLACNSELDGFTPSIVDTNKSVSDDGIVISISYPNSNSCPEDITQHKVPSSISCMTAQEDNIDVTSIQTIAVEEEANDINHWDYSEQKAFLPSSHKERTIGLTLPLPLNSSTGRDDVNEIPPWCCSQQKAVLKTSQIKESTGQSHDMYSCNFCAFNCPGKSGMEDHALLEHKSLKCFVCTLCNVKSISKEQFESHFRTKHMNVEEHKCQTCDMVFDGEEKLFQHIESHTDPVSCRVCHSMFSTEKLLLYHMASMHPDSPRWSCHICYSGFSTRKSLSDHILKVHKERKRDKDQDRPNHFTCKHCGINFHDKKSSAMHKRKFHWKPRAKEFQCDFCSYVTTSKDRLITHERTHTGEKPFMCEVCGRGFAQLSYLTKHNRLHTGEKPYKCQYCDRAFVSSSSRLGHERRHRNERPYVCQQCNKTFRNSSQLTLHIETHNELRAKRFQCPCGAAFDTKRNLNRHAVRHTGIKAFKCELCKACFTHPENVKGHQKSGACQNRILKLKKAMEQTSTG